jgi:hypothetical protein
MDQKGLRHIWSEYKALQTEKPGLALGGREGSISNFVKLTQPVCPLHGAY